MKILIALIVLSVFGFLVLRRSSIKSKLAALEKVEPSEEVRVETPEQVEAPRVEDTPKKRRINPLRKDYVAKTDSKRKRLRVQPGNHSIVPEGMVVDKDGSFVEITKDFEYKFFGTQLIVEDSVLVSGLPKKLHRLEMIDGVVYIDGRKYSFHPDNLEILTRVAHGQS
jgi:hypothetical protein